MNRRQVKKKAKAMGLTKEDLILNAKVDQAYNEYRSLTKMASEYNMQIKTYTKDIIRNAIISEHSAGASWQESAATVAELAFTRSFNTYSQGSIKHGTFKEGNIVVRSRRQAETFLERLKEIDPKYAQDVSIIDIQTGKFNIQEYFDLITANLDDLDKFGMVHNLFFGSD